MSRTTLSLNDSPVRVARQKLARTIEEAAEEANVHWQAWYLTECGVYNDVPPAIADYLAAKGRPVDDDAYTWFRENQQRKFGNHYFRNFKLPEPDLRVAPIKALRDEIDVSRLHFAKSLCVQPALLYKLERAETRALPSQIRAALLTAGLTHEQVEELNERCIEFYESS